VDAETNQPPAKCTVLRGWVDNDQRATEWQPFWMKTVTDGRYEFELTEDRMVSRIRVEAEGYMPAVSRPFKPYDPDKGNVTCDFKLHKAALFKGIVLDADGNPLADAEVFLARYRITVQDRKADSHSRNWRHQITRTDAAGRFEFTPECEPFYIVVLHPRGFAKLTEEEFAKSTTIRIEPWTEENSSFHVERRPPQPIGRIEPPKKP
jgi:hypothetical protein